MPSAKVSKLIKIGPAAKALGVSIKTLRRWEAAGKISSIKTPGGTRLYSLDILSQVNHKLDVSSFKKAKPSKVGKAITKVKSVETVHAALVQTEVKTEPIKADQIIKREFEKQQSLPPTPKVWHINNLTTNQSNSSHPSSSIPSIFLNIKRTYIVATLAIILTITTLFTSLITGAYLINPTDTQKFLSSDPKSSFLNHKSILASSLSPFNYLSQSLVGKLSPPIASLINPTKKTPTTELASSQVLAEETVANYLEINSDTILNGTLNGVTISATNSGILLTDKNTNRSLTLSGPSITLNQAVSTTSAPTFSSLTLSGTTNQLIMGSTGTLTWTPTGAKTLTLPNATDTLIGRSTTDTLTNKTISGSDNTISNIQSSALSGSFTGITGVGTIGTGTWNGTKIGTGYGGTGITTYTTGDLLYASASDTLSKLAVGTTGQVLTITSGAPAWEDPAGGAGTVPSVNSLTGALTIAGGGINAISALGTTITVTGTEADTLASVTARGASTSDAVTFSSTINSNTFTSTALSFAGASPAISASSAGTSISIDANATGKVSIAGNSTGDVDIAGGSANFGCTVNNTTGSIVCSGDITGGSTGTNGYWGRTGTSLSPATAGDSITTTGGISTTGSGTLSVAGSATFSSTINTNTFTSTALTFAGTSPVLSAATAATDISLNPGVDGSVLLAGGSASYGCSVNDTTGDLTCTGAITSAGTGAVGYWQSNGLTPPTLSPAITGGHMTTSGNIYTSGAGTMTSGGLLTGQTGLTVSGGAISLNNSSNYNTIINTGTSTGTISIGNSLAGAITIQSGAASTFHAPANTATAFKLTDGTNNYLSLDTRNTLSGVSALTLASGTAPTIASGASAEYTTLTTTPPTITLTGTTQVTSQMDSHIFNAPTITDSEALTVDKAATLTINGAPISGATGLTTITDSYALKVNAAGVDSGTGTVTNAYGLSVDAPTGAGTNYSAIFNGGNVGIGTTAPAAPLSVGSTSQFQVSSTGAVTAVGVDSGSGLIQGTGGQTVSGNTTLAATAGNTVAIGNSTGAMTLASGGTSAWTNTSGNLTISTATSGTLALTSAGALNLTAGAANPVTLTSTNATGTTTSSGFVITDNSLTSGTGSYFSSSSLVDGKLVDINTGAANTLTTGRLLNIATTATSLTSGQLASFDWSPTGTTNIYATGDLVSISTGNAYAFVGNLLNVKSQGSSVFSISDTSVTTSLPTAFNAPGDVSIAYDINMTNPTASFIKSAAPLYITPGETFNSSDLVLTTYNQGSVILAKDFAGSAVTNYLSQISGSDVTANANTNYGLYSSITHTGNAAKTGVGLYSTVSSSSTTGDTLVAADLATSATGVLGGATTRNVYGLRSQPSSIGASTAGTTNVYGGYMKSGGVVGAGGTINSYGLYIANGTMNTTGTSTNIGLYVETPSGADTNYAAIFAGGNVGIGTTTPGAALELGTGNIKFKGDDANNGGGQNALIAYGSTNFAWTDGWGNLKFGTKTNQTLGLETSGYGDFYLKDNSASRNVIQYCNSSCGENGGLLLLQPSGGNVGIGDTSPDAKLDIDSTSTTGGDFLITNTGIATSGTIAGITANSVTAGDLLTISGTALTTGSALIMTGPSSAGVTDHFSKLTSDIGSASSLLNLNPDFSGSAVTGYGVYNLATDATANANTDYGYYSSLALTGNAAKTGVGLYSTVTSSSTTGDTLVAADLATSATGAVGASTRTNIGLRTQPASTGVNDNALSIQNLYGIYNAPSSTLSVDGTTDVYGEYIATTASHNADAGTVNQYGLYIDNGTSGTNGTSTKTGLYVATPTGADTNYGAIIAGGNVGIGDATPSYPLEVNTDLATNYVSHFFNDGNNANRYGIQIQAGADDGSGTTYYLNALDGDGGQVGYIANTAGTFALSDVSDIRTKTNISNTSLSGLEILNGLRIVDFNRLQNPDGPRITGFIAQEAQEVFPQMVTTGPDGMLGISKELLIPVLVKGIQETDSRLKELEDKIASMSLPADATQSALQAGASLNDLVAGVSTSSANIDTLSTLNLTISGDLKSLGNTFLGNTTIAGNFSVDGTLSLTGDSLNSIGTLYLQDNPLADKLDLFNGVVQIDKKGNITAQGELTTTKVKVNSKDFASSSIGSGQILASDTQALIQTAAVTNSSKIFITPTTSTGSQTIIVSQKLPGQGFIVSLDHTYSQDVKFDWFIVDEVN